MRALMYLDEIGRKDFGGERMVWRMVSDAED